MGEAMSEDCQKCGTAMHELDDDRLCPRCGNNAAEDVRLQLKDDAAPGATAQNQGEPVAVMYADGSVLTKAECGSAFDICCKVETPLYTRPAEQPQGEPIYQVMYRGDGGGGWCDVEKDSYDMKVPHPKHWETRIVYTRPAEQPEPISSTSDKYKAELYDEVWQLARDMGFGNVTDALMKLERTTVPAQPRKSDSWSKDWREQGFNYCIETAIKALKYLADHPRPSGGESRYNAEHLIMTAQELALTRQELLIGRDRPAPAAVVLPDRKGYLSPTDQYADGWNACLDEVARLNPEGK